MAAERIVGQGERRVARSLCGLEVASWRAQALGPTGPWEPVLFAVAGDRVRAYAGRRLVLELVRVLGGRRGLALASELGQRTAPADAGPTLTRRRVLVRLAELGTVLGFLASGKLALPAGIHAEGAGEARPRWAVEPVRTSLLDSAGTRKFLAELLA